MSGEGVISNVSEVRARIEEHLRPRFDKRPGALEATRDLQLVGAVATHLPTGWSIGLVVDGGAEISTTSVSGARKLANEITRLCDLIEHGFSE